MSGGAAPKPCTLRNGLCKDLDGGVCFYTDAELRREFEARPS